MSEKLSGVYTTVDTRGFVPDIATTPSAVAIIGHMNSGTASSVTNGDKFSSTNSAGTIYEFNSLSEAKETIGTVPASGSWTDGTFGSGASAGYDTDYNLIRGIELIYQGNPSARTYVAILSGTGTDAKTEPNGLSNALSSLLDYNDIEFITIAGLEYSDTMKTHAVSASSQSNEAERIYIGGISLNDAYSGSTDINKEDTFDVSEYTAYQEDNGRGICFIGNAQYQFLAGFQSGSTIESSKEVGGNFLACYVAGRLSAVSEEDSLLGDGAGILTPYYNGRKRIWSKSQLETNYDNRMLSIRFDPNHSPSFYFEKAHTFSPKASPFKLITKRRIVDRVVKDVRDILKSQIGQPNIPAKRGAIEDVIKRKLRNLIREGLLIGSISAEVYVLTGDVGNGVLRADIDIQPVTEIEEIQLTVGVDL